MILGQSIANNNTLQKLALFGNIFSHSNGEIFHNQMDHINDIGLELDIEIYSVDGFFMTAEKLIKN